MAALKGATTTGVNLRRRASADASILRQLSQGDQIEVIGNQGLWLQVRHNGQTGFVKMDFVQGVDAVEPAWTTTVAASKLNVRQEASASSAVLGQLSKGQSVEVVGLSSGWLRVRFGNQTGFIAAEFTQSTKDKDRLTPEEIKQERQRIAQEQNKEVRGDLFEELQSKVIYQSQRDNEARDSRGNKVETKSGNMCNLTSLGMGLAYLGIPNPDPNQQYEDALEAIRAKHVGFPRTDSRGWGGVAQRLGAGVDIFATEVAQGRDWWEANVRPRLRQGNAVIMSIGEHIVRVQQVAEDALVVDDPYGQGRLLPGKTPPGGPIKAKYTGSGLNEYGKKGETAGEDVRWPWQDVSQHAMRWIAQLSLGGTRDASELPAIEDSGTVLTDDAVGDEDAAG